MENVRIGLILYFMAIPYNMWSFGIFFPLCLNQEKSGNPAMGSSRHLGDIISSPFSAIFGQYSVNKFGDFNLKFALWKMSSA
jgi:hypothetical protein